MYNFIIIILLGIVAYFLYQQTKLKKLEFALKAEEKLQENFNNNFPNLSYLKFFKDDLKWFQTRWGKGNGLGLAYDPYGLEKNIYKN